MRFSVNGTSYHGTVVAVGACQHESSSKLTSLLAYIDVHAFPCTSHIHTADCIYTMPYDDAVYSQRHLSRGNIPDAEPLLARGRSSTSSFSSITSARNTTDFSDSDEAVSPEPSPFPTSHTPPEPAPGPYNTSRRHRRRRTKTNKPESANSISAHQSLSSSTTSAPPHIGAETRPPANGSTSSI